jgi:hypothetical protein
VRNFGSVEGYSPGPTLARTGYRTMLLSGSDNVDQMSQKRPCYFHLVSQPVAREIIEVFLFWLSFCVIFLNTDTIYAFS